MASLFTDPFSSLLTEQLGREIHFSMDPDPDLEFTAAAALSPVGVQWGVGGNMGEILFFRDLTVCPGYFLCRLEFRCSSNNCT